MEEAMTNWLNWLRLKVSPRTAEAYAWEVERLARAHPGKRPREYREADLTAYLAERRAGGLGAAAIKRAVAAYRSFFGWCCAKRNPAAGLPYPTVKRKVQRTLTWDDFLRVLTACDTASDKGKRDVALLCLLLDTGLRASEVCRLKLADLNLENLSLRVVVKGGDEAEGVFTVYTAAQVSAWLAARPRYASDDTVFVSVSGGTAGKRLTPDGLKDILRKRGQAVGLALSPHDLRRTFATLSTINGAPSRLVQQGGRWGNLGMVERYTAALPPHAIRRYLPTGRLSDDDGLHNEQGV